MDGRSTIVALLSLAFSALWHRIRKSRTVVASWRGVTRRLHYHHWHDSGRLPQPAFNRLFSRHAFVSKNLCRHPRRPAAGQELLAMAHPGGGERPQHDWGLLTLPPPHVRGARCLLARTGVHDRLFYPHRPRLPAGLRIGER